MAVSRLASCLNKDQAADPLYRQRAGAFLAALLFLSLADKRRPVMSDDGSSYTWKAERVAKGVAAFPARQNAQSPSLSDEHDPRNVSSFDETGKVVVLVYVIRRSKKAAVCMHGNRIKVC